MRCRRLTVLGTCLTSLWLTAGHAYAAAPVDPAKPLTVDGVISSLQGWLSGLLVALATLYLTIGGIRYLTAGGDPTNIEKGKSALKYAAIGYAIAALASVLVSALQSVVGR
jgi:Type IV secretion system pilin